MANSFLTHFAIHRRFRNGVFSLFIIITVLCVALFFLEQKSTTTNDLVPLDEYEVALAKLKENVAAKKKAFVQKPFNPNFISDYKGYVLGISPEALDKLRVYRAADKWINSAKDFQTVTGVTDSLLAQLTPLFKFPKRKIFQSQNNIRKGRVKSYAEKSDLNTVSAIQLQEAIGLPDFVAKRVIKYRNHLGGFVDDIQLQDVYGLYPKQVEKALSLFTVKKKPLLIVLDVNTATAKELMTVPYFDFEMALAIRDFVKENGKVESFYEFDKILGFPTEKINRISLYLKI